MSQRFMLRAKIHRATVTEANVDYEGSLTIDRRLLELADILPYEQVVCWNVTRGTRFTTYAIEGDRDSGVMCVNGAAAHLASVGDLIIIATFTQLSDAESRKHSPKLVFLDPKNRPLPSRKEVPGPARSG